VVILIFPKVIRTNLNFAISIYCFWYVAICVRWPEAHYMQHFFIPIRWLSICWPLGLELPSIAPTPVITSSFQFQKCLTHFLFTSQGTDTGWECSSTAEIFDYITLCCTTSCTGSLSSSESNTG